MAKKILDRSRLENLRKELQFKDAGIFEKSVYAFILLGELLHVYPEVIFKGGTSLLLHIFPPERLSIDIDILLPPEAEEGLENNLVKMVAHSNWFDSVEEDKRQRRIPKAHYKFLFKSQFSQISQYVLLDVVFSDSPYKRLVKKDITRHSMNFAGAGGIVKMPTPEGMTGDKLTAISPKTIGIPLNEKRSMEFIKQIIDLGGLFNVANDVVDLRDTFMNTVKQENAFRGASYTSKEVIEDILDMAFKYSQSLLKGSDNSFPEIKYITDGLRKIVNHLKKRMDQKDVKIVLAKIAYITCVIRDSHATRMIKKIDFAAVKNLRLEGKYKILEGLKRTNPEAYFYWLLGYGKE